MKILKSRIFREFPEVKFGFSTKEGLDRLPPFFFNMSLSVGDEPQIVEENRTAFLESLDIPSDKLAFQEQIHSDIIRYVEKPGFVGESDALITDVKNLAIGVFSADCTPIFLYDPEKSVAAAVHSGWKGTEKKILEKTIARLKDDFGVNSAELRVFIGPTISRKRYPVDADVAKKFDEKYYYYDEIKYHLDVKQINYDLLIANGVNEKKVDVSPLCTYENNFLHSYRRAGKVSGRALGVIMISE